METFDYHKKYSVHNMYGDVYFLLGGISWELEEELEKQNIRVEWHSNDLLLA